MENHHANNVRYTLALQGYYPEHFIQDLDTDIRGVVTINNPHFIPQVINEPQMLDDNALDGFDIEAAQLKLDALKRIPTIIEHTMSRYQLYKNNNPMWTNGLSAVFASAMLYDEYNSEEDFDSKLAFLFDEFL